MKNKHLIAILALNLASLGMSSCSLSSIMSSSTLTSHSTEISISSSSSIASSSKDPSTSASSSSSTRSPSSTSSSSNEASSSSKSSSVSSSSQSEDTSSFQINKKQWATAVDIDQLGKTKVECQSNKSSSTQTYDGKTVCFSTSSSKEYYTIDSGAYFLYSSSGSNTTRKSIDEATYQEAKDKFYGTFASKISFANLHWSVEDKAYSYDDFYVNNVHYSSNRFYFQDGSLVQWKFSILYDEGVENCVYAYSHPTELNITLPSYSSPYAVSESNFRSALSSSNFSNVTVIAKKMASNGKEVEESTYKNSSSDGIFEGYLNGSNEHYYIDLNKKKYYRENSNGSYSCSDYEGEETYIGSLSKMLSKLSFSDFVYNDSNDRYEAESIKIDDVALTKVQLGFSSNKLVSFSYCDSANLYENRFCNHGKAILALPSVGGDSHQVSQKQFLAALSSSSFGNVQINFEHEESTENSFSKEYINSYIAEDGLLQYVAISGNESSQTYYDFANNIAYVYQGVSANPKYKIRNANSNESQASKVASQLSKISYSQLLYDEDDGSYNCLQSGKNNITQYIFVFKNQRLVSVEFESQSSNSDTYERWEFSDYGKTGVTLPDA